MMTGISKNGALKCAVVICGGAAVLSGCAERKVHAFPWATTTQVRPIAPVIRGDFSAKAADIAPDFGVEPPSNDSKLFGLRPIPARPRAPLQPRTESGNGSKVQALVPELSPQESAAAQQQYSESSEIVERNLALARGKKLTAVQTDMISKVNGFMAEAREASGEGDWARARNLSRKAQILSDELVASF